MSNWNPERWPFTKALEQFVNLSFSRIRLSFKPPQSSEQCTRNRFRSDAPGGGHQDLGAVVNSSPRARQGAPFISMLPTLFGVNVLGGDLGDIILNYRPEFGRCPRNLLARFGPVFGSEGKGVMSTFSGQANLPLRKVIVRTWPHTKSSPRRPSAAARDGKLRAGIRNPIACWPSAV